MEPQNFSERSKNTNRDSCCVSGCGSRANKNLGTSFYRFPKPDKQFVSRTNIFGTTEKIDRLTAWKIAVRLHNVTSRMKVCSKHFKRDDYFLPGMRCNRRILKKNAVPSINLPISVTKKTNNGKSIRRVKKDCETVPITRHQLNLSCKTNTNDCANASVIDNDHSYAVKHASEERPCFILITSPKVDAECQTYDSGKVTSEAEVQVNTYVEKTCNFADFIASDTELSTVTGIESFKMLDKIVGLLNVEQKSMKMNIRDRVIMVYAKLKQNLSYAMLAVMFKFYSAKHCQRIFEDIIKKLSSVFKETMLSPSKEGMDKNVSTCQSFESTDLSVPESGLQLDRSNQRVKIFKVVDSKLPKNLVSLHEDILIVISATVNMNARLMKYD